MSNNFIVQEEFEIGVFCNVKVRKKTYMSSGRFLVSD
jgi:hypothetical protein